MLHYKSCGQSRVPNDAFWSVWSSSPSWRDLSWMRFRSFQHHHLLSPVACTKSHNKHICKTLLVLRIIGFALSLTLFLSTGSFWLPFESLQRQGKILRFLLDDPFLMLRDVVFISFLSASSNDVNATICALVDVSKNINLIVNGSNDSGFGG